MAEGVCPRSDLPPAQCAHCRGSKERRPAVPRASRDLVTDLARRELGQQVVLLDASVCESCDRALAVGELVTLRPDEGVVCELCCTA